MDAGQLERHLVAIDDQGDTIVENSIGPTRVAEFVSEIHRVEKERGSAPKGNASPRMQTLGNQGGSESLRNEFDGRESADSTGPRQE
jgi:hypothetical protein